MSVKSTMIAIKIALILMGHSTVSAWMDLYCLQITELVKVLEWLK